MCATELLRKDIVSGKSLHGLTKNLYKALKREAFRVTKQKKGEKSHICEISQAKNVGNWENIWRNYVPFLVSLSLVFPVHLLIDTWIVDSMNP